MKSKSAAQVLPSWMVFLILASAALVLAYAYYYITAKPNYDMRLELHQEIISGQAPSPYQYRLLVPFAGEGLFRVFGIVLPQRYAFGLAYVFLDLSGIFFLLVGVFKILEQWFRREYALLGSLFCAAVLPVTFFEHYYQPWSFWEAALYSFGLWLVSKNRRVWLGGIVFLASINRETGLILAAAFFVISFHFQTFKESRAANWQTIKWTGLYFGIWALVFISLRLIRPASSEVESIAQIFQHNIQPVFLAKTALNLMLFLGAFWLLAVKGWRNSPKFLRRAAWVLPAHFVLILIYAYWSEVRVLMPHYPVLIGLGLSSFGYPAFVQQLAGDPSFPPGVDTLHEHR